MITEKIHSRAYETAMLAAGTIALGTAAVLGGKGLWQLGRGAVAVTKWSGSNAWGVTKWSGSNAWGATKWTGSNAWGATKWTGSSTWKATKWTARSGFSITKYVIVHIPAAIKWTALSMWGATKWTGRNGWSATKWTFSCVKHPITTASNLISNAGYAASKTYHFSVSVVNIPFDAVDNYVLPFLKDGFDSAMKQAKNIGHDISETFPITGRVATKVGNASTTAYTKVIAYNPIPPLFRKAPSLTNPTYATFAAVISLFVANKLCQRYANQAQQYQDKLREVADRAPRDIRAAHKEGRFDRRTGRMEADPFGRCNLARDLKGYGFKYDLKASDARRRATIELFTIVVGTMILTPVLAKHFSGHVVTRTQAFGWALLFGGAKFLHTKFYDN